MIPSSGVSESRVRRAVADLRRVEGALMPRLTYSERTALAKANEEAVALLNQLIKELNDRW